MIAVTYYLRDLIQGGRRLGLELLSFAASSRLISIMTPLTIRTTRSEDLSDTLELYGIGSAISDTNIITEFEISKF